MKTNLKLNTSRKCRKTFNHINGQRWNNTHQPSSVSNDKSDIVCMRCCCCWLLLLFLLNSLFFSSRACKMLLKCYFGSCSLECALSHAFTVIITFYYHSETKCCIRSDLQNTICNKRIMQTPQKYIITERNSDSIVTPQMHHQRHMYWISKRENNYAIKCFFSFHSSHFGKNENKK